jgi:hypothetical protein
MPGVIDGNPLTESGSRALDFVTAAKLRDELMALENPLVNGPGTAA